MSPEEFDRSPDGWRKTAGDGSDQKACLAAGEAISSFVRVQDPMAYGAPETLTSLCFHAGQMYALGGDAASASLWIGRARTRLDMYWNAYVDGTLAFLDGDRPGLLRAISFLSVFGDSEDDLNRRVLDRLDSALSKGIRDYKTPYLDNHDIPHHPTTPA